MSNAGKPEPDTGLGPSRQEGTMQLQAGKIRSHIAKLAIAGVLLLAMACSPIYQNHGFAPTDGDLALLEVGRDNRESVARVVGRPSTSTLLNEHGWYYVQSRWKHTGVLPPKEEEREVVAITFDEGGFVENIERFGLAEGRVVPISRRVTESNIKGVTLLTALFANFGRLDIGQLLDN
jgi:outer membrane protein assembly factor BamE (lipoprotein component of BamABCDE complex)